MAERELVPPLQTPMFDPKTGIMTLPWQDFFSLLASKIRVLETP